MRKPLVAKRQAGRAIDDRFARALDRAEGFFMKTGKLHRAMSELARRLDEAEIPSRSPTRWHSMLTGTSE